MSEHILDQKSALSGSVQQPEKVQAKGENVSTGTPANIFKFLMRKLEAGFMFLVEIGEEVHKLRLENQQYDRTRW